MGFDCELAGGIEQLAPCLAAGARQQVLAFLELLGCERGRSLRRTIGICQAAQLGDRSLIYKRTLGGCIRRDGRDTAGAQAQLRGFLFRVVLFQAFVQRRMAGEFFRRQRGQRVDLGFCRLGG